MSDVKQQVKQKWRLILTVSVFFLVILMGQDLIREVIVFRRNITILEEEFARDVKDDIFELVDHVDIDFSIVIDNLIPLTIEHAEETTQPVIAAAEAVRDISIGDDISTIETTIINVVQNYNVVDTEHIFHVYDTDGFLRYDGYDNSVQNTTMIDAVDGLNRTYVSDLLLEIENSTTNTGSVLYYYEENDEMIPSILFGKRVETTDIIVTGTIEIDRFNNTLKSDNIAALQGYYTEGENSVYVLSEDGTILFHQNPNAIGISPLDDEYPLWQSTLEFIISFVEGHDEGFITYDFYSNYQNGVVEEKIAYVKYIEEWNIVIGASSSFDTYQSLLDQYTHDNYETVLWIKIPAYIIIFVLAFVIVWFLKQNIDLSQELLSEDEELYRTFADMTSEIIMITDKQGKIIFTNKKGTDIIYGDRQSDDEVYFDQILVEEDGYYILYGVKEDLFVKYITEPIVYNNMKSDLYIINNVTDKIMTKRQLEALSMKDDLTGLGNRRMLVRDYNKTILPFVKDNGIAHLAMIDLDNFKPANDLYGHTFGDVVLQNIASIFASQISDQVKIYRIGGDEFALLFMGMNTEEIDTYLRHLQQEIYDYPYDKDIEVGFSGGVVEIQITKTRRRFSDFYDRADKLLYKSKATGRNTINY